MPKMPHQIAAYAVLTSGADLRQREGQFLGGLSFDANLPTPKQANWLKLLCDRHGVSFDGDAHVG